MNEWEWNLLEDEAPLANRTRDGIAVAPGDRVRLRPRRQGDAMDLFLANKIAIVEAIEQDYENQIHVAVVVEEDPGRDLGLDRQPGHRFFFGPDEVELVERRHGPPPSAGAPGSILIAGVGNIFFGDDGFGVEVVRRIGQGRFPDHVTVAEFGIRGFDLACALSAGYDVAILVDACPRGSAAGTLHVIEPDLLTPGSDVDREPEGGPHGLDPLNVIRLARLMGPTPRRILIVGCDPETLGGEEGAVGLSVPVSAAVAEAVPLIESLVARIVEGNPLEPDGRADSERDER